MQLENSFEVGAPPDVAWRLLNDVPTVLPCMPGAELVEVVSDDSWKAKLHVKLGPISLQFLADVDRVEVDTDAGTVVLAVKAREAKGRGAAEARIVSSLAPIAGGSRVDLRTELELRGAVAQYGRGVIGDVASTLTDRFAECLRGKLADVERPAAPTEIDGFGLVFRAVWRAFVQRLRGRRA